MLELLKDNPWLIVVAMGMAIPIISIVVGTITSYLARVHQAELDAGLKQEMLQRGMSAEEIKTVIEASASSRGKSCAPDSAARQQVS